MSQKPSIFEPIKQPGKVTNAFSNIRQSQPSFQSNERTTSPFRGYKNDMRSPDYGVSRGLFTGASRDTLKDQNDTFLSQRSLSGDLETKSQINSQIQEIMQQEFKSLISQWREEIFEEVKNSIKEYKDKAQRSRETIDMIKHHLKANSHSINDIDSKLADYDEKLAKIGELIQNEILTVRNSIPHVDEHAHNNDSNRSFAGLKEEILQELDQNISECNELQNEEYMKRFEKLRGELSEGLEGKLNKVVDHLGNKINVIEKQLQTMDRAEDPEMEKVKYEIENKIQESSQSLKDQMATLKKLIEKTATEARNSVHQKESEIERERLSDANRQLERINQQVAQQQEDIGTFQEYFENKTNEYEDRWQEQFVKLQSELKTCTNEIKSLSERVNNTKLESNMSLVMQMNTINNDVESLSASQKGFQDQIRKQEHELSDIKHLTHDRVKKQQHEESSSLLDPRLKKIEEQVDGLSRTIEALKYSTSHLTSSPGSDSTSTTTDRFRSDLGPLSQPKANFQNKSPVPTNEDQVNEQHHSRFEEKGSNSGWTSSQRLSPNSKPEPRFEEQRGHEGGYYTSNTLLNRSPETNQQESSSNLADSKSQVRHKSPTQYRDSGEYRENTSPNSYPSSGHPGKKTDGSFVSGPVESSGDRNRAMSHSSMEKHAHLPQQSSRSGGKQKSGDRSPKRGSEDYLNQANDPDSDEVMYLDEDGYFMDEDGNYILDEQGQRLRLNEEHIQRLKENNLLEEES